MTPPLPLIPTTNLATSTLRDVGVDRSDPSERLAFSRVLAAEQRVVKDDTSPSKSLAQPESPRQDDPFIETTEPEVDILDVTQSVLSKLPQQMHEIVVEVAAIQQLQMSPPATKAAKDLLTLPADENMSENTLLAQTIGAGEAQGGADPLTITNIAIPFQSLPTVMATAKKPSEGSVLDQSSTFSVSAEKSQAARIDPTAKVGAALSTFESLGPTLPSQVSDTTLSPSSAIEAPTAHISSAIATLSPPTTRATSGPAAIPVMPTLQLQARLGSAQWSTDLGQQLILMSHNAQNGMQSAELRLDPPEIGPLRITLNLNEGVAKASFFSSHAGVRQAVEAALPQLQQALAQSGISLDQCSVGDHATAHQEGFAQQHSDSRRQNGNDRKPEGATEIAPTVVTVARATDAIVDTFV
jgi:flagellar hook-length control protein FliK